MKPAVLDQIKRALKGAQQVLVIAHIGPDGDALGSLTGMGLGLAQVGKKPVMVCDDGMISDLAFLPGADQVRRRVRANRKFDLVIAVDCGDEERMGRAFSQLPQPRPPVINIDHHISNTFFGTVNLVDAEATATAEILTELLPALGITIDKAIATCLLTGLVTDTLAFRIPSVTAKTLAIAGRLIDAGADLADITQRALVVKPLATILAWRTGLNNLRLEGNVAWTTLSQDEQRAISERGVSHDGLSNMLSEIAEAGVGIVFSEKEDGRIKVGFRSRPPFDVSIVASELGGGGHRNAAGATVDGPLLEAARLVVDRMLAAIAGNQEAAPEAAGADR